MSKTKGNNLASLRKQIEDLLEKKAKVEQRIKENFAASLTDDAVEKLDRFSDADLKKLGKKLSKHLDSCIAELEAEKAEKKAKADAAKAAEKPVLQSAQPTANAGGNSGNYGNNYRQNNGYQQNS